MTFAQVQAAVREAVQESLAGAELGRLTFTFAEAAKKLGRSARTVSRMVERGELHPVKVAGKRMISARELERLTTPAIEKRRQSVAHRTGQSSATRASVEAMLKRRARG